jgi:hypothetical protein
VNIARSLVNLIVSVVGALLPLLFLSGSFSPVQSYIPSLPNLLGNQSALYNSLQQAFGASLPVGLLPVGTAGITGVTLYTISQRVLGSVRAATYSTPKFDASEFFRSIQSKMPNMNLQSAVQSIPQDMSKAQFLILTNIRRGEKNPKKIAKMLSMDKKSVEEQTRALQGNGYLTRDNKLTPKGLEILS